jgi:predicted ATP-binding protein involved in virulence
LKLKKIKFQNHNTLNNLEANSCDDNGSPLNTVVVIGENGTGKTTLLKSIFEAFEIDRKAYSEKGELSIELNSGTHYVLVKLDENTTPIFKNSLGKKFDINGLSSGEKQLFLRALSLKFLEVNNSIILIDELEISLHPSWQQKIIKGYENIGENNQLIIAIHSPHIVSDIKAEQLRILRKDLNGVVIVENEKVSETYEHTVESILRTAMKMDSVRNKDII